MDRNTIVGIALIFAIFFAWQWVTRTPAEELERQQRIQDSIAMEERRIDSLAKLAQQDQQPGQEATVPTLNDSMKQVQYASAYGPFAAAASGKEQEVVLENNLIKITFTNKGGRIKSAELKEHFKVIKDTARQDVKIPLMLLEDPKNRFGYFLPMTGLPSGGVSTEDLYFEVQRDGSNTIRFRAPAGDGRYFEQTYSLKDDSYLLDYDLQLHNLNGLLNANEEALTFTWVNYLDRIEKNMRMEQMNSTLYFKQNDENPDNCSFSGDDEESVEDGNLKWISNSNQFFNTSLIADNVFSSGIFAVQSMDEESEDLKKLTTQLKVPVGRGADAQFGMQLYIGPNEFNRLYAVGDNLEDVIPFGWNIFGTINRWVIRPIFTWLSTFIGSKGIVILFLTLIVKLLLYPLTYRMLHSQSKMSALKPEIEKMRDKYKDDQQKQQMETMKLYREFGVNPLGSCLPMVAQLPIWFALYRFFPAAIEFRQEGFLWANDLSSYDEFVQLPFSIPLGFGSHISLFTMLWAFTTLIYTYYNSRHMDLSANPAMKYMQYIMPIFFLGFFNSYSSGLTAYLLFSNIINITQTLVTKNYIIDQKKIKADMDDYRKKPKKKGSFSQRLEKALEDQRKVAAQQQSNRNRNKKK